MRRRPGPGPLGGRKKQMSILSHTANYYCSVRKIPEKSAIGEATVNRDNQTSSQLPVRIHPRTQSRQALGSQRRQPHVLFLGVVFGPLLISGFLPGFVGEGAWASSIGIPLARPATAASGNAAEIWRNRCPQT